MTAYITTIDDGTLRISELVGDHAIEVARIKIRRTDHNTITALVANLLPYLAGASGILATPRAHTNGDTPAPLGAGRGPPGGPTAAGAFAPPSREGSAGIETDGARDGSAVVGRGLKGG